MKKIGNIGFSLLVFLSLMVFACRKDIGKPIPTDAKINDTINKIVEFDNFICEDTLRDWKKYNASEFANIIGCSGGCSVSRVLYDTKDKNVIYYLTSEVGKQTFVLWRYNRKTKEKKYLDEALLGNIDINKNGWLVYDKMNWNIYKIKCNGDSLKQLTFDGSSKFPCWSDDETSIYFINDGPITGGVFSITDKGLKRDTVKNCTSFVKRKNNQLYFVATTGPYKISIIQRDLLTKQEKTIVTQGNFNDFYTNENNTVLYWWNDNCLAKTDLVTMQTVNLVNVGGESMEPTMFYRRSILTGQFIAVKTTCTFIDYLNLKFTHKIVEFTSDGTCMRTVEIPD